MPDTARVRVYSAHAYIKNSGTNTYARGTQRNLRRASCLELKPQSEAEVYVARIYLSRMRICSTWPELHPPRVNPGNATVLYSICSCSCVSVCTCMCVAMSTDKCDR